MKEFPRMERMSAIKLSDQARNIRIAASAAICGLSISLLASEGLHQKMSNFDLSAFNSANDRQVLRFPVLNPILVAWQIAESVKVPSFGVEESIPVLADKTEDTAVIIHAAALERPRNTRIDVSIQMRPAEVSPILSSNFKQLSSFTTAVQNFLETQSEITVDRAAGNELVGEVMATQTYFGKGHFEVGVYEKVDDQGNPLGFPSAQDILKKSVKKFSLHLKEPMQGKELFLFARYLYRDQSGEKKEEWFAYPANPIRTKTDIAKNLKIPVSTELAASEMAERATDEVKVVASGVNHAGVMIRSLEDDAKIVGTVRAMFAAKGQVLPLDGVQVRIRGSKLLASTDIRGNFDLGLRGISGKVVLEFSKPGFIPMMRVVKIYKGKVSLDIEMAGREAIEKMAISLGLRQLTYKSVFIAKITHDGVALPGMSSQLSLKADGPYYFTPEGHPSSGKNLNSTTLDGRLIYFNVDPGVGYLDSTMVNGEHIAPIIVSTIESGDLVYKDLESVDGQIGGRVFDPVEAPGNALVPIKNTRVRVQGSGEWSTTDTYGSFELPALRFYKNEELLLELENDKYYNHRYFVDLEFSKAKNNRIDLNLYSFPKTYINSLAKMTDNTLDPYTGIIMGHVNLPKKIRIDALSDHSVSNSSRDYYFDSAKSLLPPHSGTNERFGTYMIFNVPAGRAILQGTEMNGKYRYFDAAYVGPSTVSVMTE
jgi:hypothetical protein